MRASEASFLRISDIDRNCLSIRVVGKGNKERIVYYGESLKNILDKYLCVRDEFLIKGNIEYLFINKNGGRLSRESIEYAINKIIKNSLINHKIKI